VHFRHVFAYVFGLESVIAAVVFGLVLAAMLAAFAVSFYRRRRRLGSFQRSENNPLELGYVGALAGMAVFLIVTSFSTTASFFRNPPAPLQIKVSAYQWCWRFTYPGGVSAGGRCAGGRLPTLIVPAGRPVRLDLASTDVLHGFWLPGLRVKMDVYPGHANALTLTVPAGRWLGRCSQFCGLYHDGMMFHLVAVRPGQFSRWLAAGGHGAVTVAGP
jgi:cytochrome c oxidase subunit 2